MVNKTEILGPMWIKHSNLYLAATFTGLRALRSTSMMEWQQGRKGGGGVEMGAEWGQREDVGRKVKIGEEQAGRSKSVAGRL